MPRTRITTKYVKNLTPEEFERCRVLNFGYNGMMREKLITARYEPAGERAVLVKNDSGQVIAWSLVMNKARGRKAAYFYVPPENRRKGFGTRMLKQVKKMDPKPYVYPHDRVSGNFFKRFKSEIRCSEWDAFYLED